MVQRYPPAQRETFAPPEDVLGQVVALQQAARSRRLALVHLLTAYAEWTPHPPEEARADVQALCDEFFRTLYPPRSHGGPPPDYEQATFHQKYWDAYQKVRLANLERHSPRVMVKQVAAEMTMPERTFYDNRHRFKLGWPPPPP